MLFIFKNYIIIINVIAFFIYGLDKVLAMIKKARIPESFLLNLSIFGGCFLGLISMYLFHHKVRKNKFVVINIVCIIIYSLLIYYIYKYK